MHTSPGSYSNSPNLCRFPSLATRESMKHCVPAVTDGAADLIGKMGIDLIWSDTTIGLVARRAMVWISGKDARILAISIFGSAAFRFMVIKNGKGVVSAVTMQGQAMHLETGVAPSPAMRCLRGWLEPRQWKVVQGKLQMQQQPLSLWLPPRQFQHEGPATSLSTADQLKGATAEEAADKCSSLTPRCKHHRNDLQQMGSPGRM